MRVYFRVVSLNILVPRWLRRRASIIIFSWLGVDFNVLLTAVRFTSEQTNSHNDDIAIFLVLVSLTDPSPSIPKPPDPAVAASDYTAWREGGATL